MNIVSKMCCCVRADVQSPSDYSSHASQEANSRFSGNVQPVEPLKQMPEADGSKTENSPYYPESEGLRKSIDSELLDVEEAQFLWNALDHNKKAFEYATAPDILTEFKGRIAILATGIWHETKEAISSEAREERFNCMLKTSIVRNKQPGIGKNSETAAQKQDKFLLHNQLDEKWTDQICKQFEEYFRHELHFPFSCHMENSIPGIIKIFNYELLRLDRFVEKDDGREKLRSICALTPKLTQSDLAVLFDKMGRNHEGLSVLGRHDVIEKIQGSTEKRANKLSIDHIIKLWKACQENVKDFKCLLSNISIEDNKAILIADFADKAQNYLAQCCQFDSSFRVDNFLLSLSTKNASYITLVSESVHIKVNFLELLSKWHKDQKRTATEKLHRCASYREPGSGQIFSRKNRLYASMQATTSHRIEEKASGVAPQTTQGVPEGDQRGQKKSAEEQGGAADSLRLDQPADRPSAQADLNVSQMRKHLARELFLSGQVNGRKCLSAMEPFSRSGRSGSLRAGGNGLMRGGVNRRCASMRVKAGGVAPKIMQCIPEEEHGFQQKGQGPAERNGGATGFLRRDQSVHCSGTTRPSAQGDRRYASMRATSHWTGKKAGVAPPVVEGGQEKKALHPPGRSQSFRVQGRKRNNPVFMSVRRSGGEPHSGLLKQSPSGNGTLV